MSDKDKPMSAEEHMPIENAIMWLERLAQANDDRLLELQSSMIPVERARIETTVAVNGSIKRGLTALREKAAREADGCDYCQGDEPIFAVEHDTIFVDNKGTLDVYCGENGNCPHLREQINYCPMCGRRLTKDE